MKPAVSVIIPCFNSGKYLPEALASLDGDLDAASIEVIIVDDGSSDPATLEFLQQLGKRYRVLHQENLGPAAARNTGVRNAASEFLLFLDSDNKIKSGYIKKGLAILQNQSDIAVVYSNPSFFGEALVEARFQSQPFDVFTLLIENYIDVCTLVRKSALQEVGGFDEARILFGHEDWELWIRIHLKGWGFYYLDEELFEYRVRGNSLLMEKSEADNLMAVRRFVYIKHIDLFIMHHEALRHKYEFYNYDKQRPFRTFVKNVYWKYLKRSYPV